MDLSISSPFRGAFPAPTSTFILNPKSRCSHSLNFFKHQNSYSKNPFFSRQKIPIRAQVSDPAVDDGFVIDDVPHLTDFLPDLPIVVQKDSSRGVHFRRAGPREKVYFKSEEVRACIVTCGGLCPGINTVIREIVCGLNYMYGVDDILGIQGGYRGFYSKNTSTLTPKVVNDIHKRGGTFLLTSRGGHDTQKIVDNIQDRGINQVYIIGGDGTQRGASRIYEEVEKRGLKVAVAGIPKTIDNDIAVSSTTIL
ncbi:hypothetical protein GOBAR_AA36297 [Gossypium barbadense]|uniref:Phosphofructokinase domain-containing protein n=1 Tax=Gossypium barbadense TaxID=3634 RepID=A0A2P5W021_GOSBA|nr:hypothetical protein GOBAR_AA36297 [Gossypium barbadense]